VEGSSDAKNQLDSFSLAVSIELRVVTDRHTDGHGLMAMTHTALAQRRAVKKIKLTIDYIFLPKSD